MCVRECEHGHGRTEPCGLCEVIQQGQVEYLTKPAGLCVEDYVCRVGLAGIASHAGAPFADVYTAAVPRTFTQFGNTHTHRHLHRGGYRVSRGACLRSQHSRMSSSHIRAISNSCLKVACMCCVCTLSCLCLPAVQVASRLF